MRGLLILIALAITACSTSGGTHEAESFDRNLTQFVRYALLLSKSQRINVEKYRLDFDGARVSSAKLVDESQYYFVAVPGRAPGGSTFTAIIQKCPVGDVNLVFFTAGMSTEKYALEQEEYFRGRNGKEAVGWADMCGFESDGPE